jgi:osmotically-inducible protein OsmY
MKTDAQIQKDVMEQMKWEPFLKPSEIGVSVNEGIVTLSGVVDSYAKKVYAEKAARRVSGVKAIAEEVQISVSPFHKKTDTEIAAAVTNALQWNVAVLNEMIRIKVEDGVVTLEGEVEWEFQRSRAVKSIENLAGVRFVNNLVRLKPKVAVADVEKQISEAFRRSANIDAGKIRCEAEGGFLTLRGEVRSYAEKKDAENAAWNVPGVITVNNKLEVKVPEFAFED